MLRLRSLVLSFALALAAVAPLNVHAEEAVKPAVSASDDDKVDKEIERLYEEGKYDAAFALAEKLVAEREAKLGKEHPRTASAIADLGTMNLVKGNVAAAEPLLKRAVELLEKAKGSEDALATALSNLASLYSTKGDPKRAIAMLQRAMGLEEKAGATRESEYASLLTKLATIYIKISKFSEAEKLLLKAVSIHEKRNAERGLFLDLSNLGSLYRKMGDYIRAADAYNRAVPIAKRAYGENHPEVGRLLHLIGMFLTGSDQFEKAEDNYARADKILVGALGRHHPDVAALYSDWALLLTRTGKIEKALEYRDKAQTIEEEWLVNALASGTEEDKLAYASQLEKSVDRVVSFQMNMGLGNKEVTRFVLRTILRNKAQALEAMAATTRAFRERMTSEEDKKRYDELVRVRGTLASMYTRGPRGQTVEEFQAEVVKLTREADAIEAAMSKWGASRRIPIQNVTIESVAERIPEDAALVELVQYRHRSAHFYSAASERESTPRYMAYVLRHNGDVLRIQFPVSASVIEDKVAKIRKGLQNPEDKRFFQELNLLHDIIFVRLLGELPGVKHLLISPDGDLSLVPFGALISRDGHFLAEKYTVTYLSSGRDLLQFGQHELESSAPMLVANPDYDAPGEAEQVPLPEAPRGSLPVLARVKFTPLPGTAQEAEAINDIVPNAHLKVQGVATETALKQVAGPKILHVATHGFFLDASGKAAKGSRGIELDVPTHALPTIKTAPPEAEGPKVEIVNPMFLSGLALAGANVRKGQMDDGILTAYEASALNLTGTELVVLSACETGVGTRVAREGVRGLRRALVLAGAETQVMSLWQVDDEATRDLMTSFYQNMYRKGLGRSEAMRQAQLALLAQPERKHPFYWASFIVSGNWGPISGTASSSSGKPGVIAPPGGAKGCGCQLAAVDKDDLGTSIIAFGVAFAAMRGRRRKQARN
ncbi:MAG: CHAT domain-containing protein [Polyangiaceae bacterium]|nr:CHAT domain-containing protein [Polyangiaceae bacterium]